jgi:aryl-phospho-beta-D-glucosidase BglC (GH1 family)
MLKLSVQGPQIVDERSAPVYLRGTCLGGWMNMENFIDGYPGSEHGLRAALADELGAGKAQFFFERLLDHFVTEADLAFIRQQGATVVRLPFNYRHFERDSEPGVYLEAGFTRLDQVLAWCERHGLYAILDMHAAPGWQNPDWHSDNANRQSLLWSHAQFQDRFLALWAEVARRYSGNATVAGYNVMNEPVSNAPRGVFDERRYQPDWLALNSLYRRVVATIRAIDREHIIFLEGDFFSSRFSGLEAPFAPNLVYSSHNYNRAGFGPGPYPGSIAGEWWDSEQQETAFDAQEGSRFARQHGVPLWVGEFGSVYNGPVVEVAGRMQAMDDQIAVFNARGAHWTTWTYKDVGVMGWLHLDPDSEYVQRIRQVTEAKRLLDTDFWLEWSDYTPAKQRVAELSRLVADTIGDPELDPNVNETYLRQASLANYVGELLQPYYARCFTGLSEAEIDRVLQSFRLENCRVRHDLVEVVRRHLAAS